MRVFSLFYYLATSVAKFNKGDKVMGALATMFIAMPMLLVVLRIGFAYVDLDLVIERCCSFGPPTPKNPFSAPVVSYTVLSMPVLIAFFVHIYGQCVVLEREPRVWERLLLLVVCLLYMLSLPLGFQGDIISAFWVLTGQILLYAIASLVIVSQRIHEGGLK